MAMQKSSQWTLLAVAATMVALSLAEPEPAPQNSYLPPSNGYNYPKPSTPFLTPTTQRPRPPASSFRPPPSTYGPPPTTHTDGGTILGEGIPGGHDHHHEPGMPFDFQYAVKDDEYGNDFSHNANSDGDVVRGEYRVALPDGRLQIVRYTADWATGFHADVSYEGEARYPDAPAGGYGPPKRPGGGY